MKKNIFYAVDGEELYDAFGNVLVTLAGGQKVTVIERLKEKKALRVGIGWYHGDFLKTGYMKMQKYTEFSR